MFKKFKFHLRVNTIIVVVIFCLVFTEQLSSQNFFGSISVPDPTIASFNKYIENPVNLYNGSIDISLPVYDIVLGNNKIPITLRYNTTGIKVTEESGNVGLGWNLNVGGFISQNVVGRVDNEYFFDYCEWLNSTMPANQKIYPLPGTNAGHWSWVHDYTHTLYIDDYSKINYYLNENYDPYSQLGNGFNQPDIFYFSFLNYSGKFFIDYRDNKIYQIDKKEEIQFIPLVDNNSNIIGWKAKIPNGTWYYFTVVQYSRQIGDNTNAFSSRNFYLTKIIFPDGKQLYYTYEDIGQCKSLEYLTETKCQDVRGFCIGENCPIPVTPAIYYDTKFATFEHDIKVLKSINSDNLMESISFFYSNREDIPFIQNYSSGDRKLDSIVIKSKNTNNHIRYEYEYDYFQSPIVNEDYVWSGGNSESNRKRLKLIQFGQTGLPKYHFEYSQIQLPSKQSYAQDYWGYYNGQNESTSLCSKLTSLFYDSQIPPEIPNEIISNGSIHACDTSFIQAGILKKIIYPTGGITSLRYESNSFSKKYQYNKVYYPCIQQINEYNEIREKQIVDLVPASYCNAGTNYCDGNDYFFEVSVPSKIIVSCDFNWTATDYPNISGAYVSLGTINTYNQIVDCLKQVLVPYNSNNFYHTSFELQLQPGRYGLWTHIPNCNNGIIRSVFANLHIEPLEFIFPNDFFNTSYGGGIRVRNVMQIDTDKVEINTRYLYDDGIIMSPLRYYYSNQIFNAYEVKPIPPCLTPEMCQSYLDILNTFQYVTKTSSSIIPLSYDASGGLVGYPRVKMYKIGKNAIENVYLNGYIEYEHYVFPPIVSIDLPSIPYLINGKIKKKTTYDNNSNPIECNEYEYFEEEYNRYFGVKEKLSRLCGFYDVYPIVSSSLLLKSEKSYFVDRNYNQYGMKTLSYEYNDNGQLKSTKENHISQGQSTKEKITNYSYISDISNPSTLYAKMQTDNAISPLRSKNVWVNGNKIYEEIHDYNELGTYSVPEDNSIFSTYNITESRFYPSGSNISEKVELTYNNQANIIQSHKVNDYQTFIWGYNLTSLIAQCSNATSIECGYTGFENEELNDWTKPYTSIYSKDSYTGMNSIFFNTIYGPSRDFFVGDLAENHSGYQASVWVKGSANAYLHIETNDFSINDRSYNIEKDSTAWHLLRVSLDKSRYKSIINSNLKIKVYLGLRGGGSAYFDDLRFYPLDAQMTTYTYSPLIGITSESDNNNRPIKYEYDGFGRLVLVKDFENNVIKKYEYNYKQ